MNGDGSTSGPARHRWPRFVAAAFLLGVVLAFIWVGLEARRVLVRRELLSSGSGANIAEPPPTAAVLAQWRTELAGLTNGSAAEAALGTWLDRLLAGKLAREIQLDVLEAAAKFPSTAVTQKLAQFEAARPKDDPLAGFRETLYGGDAEVGRKIFFADPNAACAKCHRVGTQGGDIGPDQSDLGKRQTREYILEAIMLPNAKIAEHFETTVVLLTNDACYAGVVKSENDTELELAAADLGVMKIKKAEIKIRDKGLSLMPEGMGQVLPKRDLRDLIEFLARQQASPINAVAVVKTNGV
jgi:putative heme-binding domain-containing protein